LEQHLDEGLLPGQVLVDLLDRDQLLEAGHAALHGQEALGHAAGPDALDEVLAPEPLDDARTGPTRAALSWLRSQGFVPLEPDEARMKIVAPAVRRGQAIRSPHWARPRAGRALVAGRDHDRDRQPADHLPGPG